MPETCPIGRAKDAGVAVPVTSPAGGAQGEPQQGEPNKMLHSAAPQRYENRKGKGLDEHPSEDTIQMLKMTELLHK